MPESTWRIVDRISALPTQTMHVWRVPLSLDPSQQARYETLVVPEELARARRFIREEHQWRFVAGRARMRCLLARYLATQPQAVHLCYEPLGKPYLDPSMHGSQLHFNFSNSHEWGLLAVSAVRQSIGVDLEQIRTTRDLDGLANRYFHPTECVAIQQDRGHEAIASFYRCWTRKEAFLKAIGKGLTFPLRDVIVSCGLGEKVEIRSIQGDAVSAHRWNLVHLEPTDEFVGALVHEAPDLSVLQCDWTEDHSGF